MPPQDRAQLRVEAIGGGFIDAIDVIRNGKLIHRVSPEISPSPISGEHETLIYLELGWGARRRSHRWQGQIGLEGGADRVR